jgi:hypothetical protein
MEKYGLQMEFRVNILIKIRKFHRDGKGDVKYFIKLVHDQQLCLLRDFPFVLVLL